MRPFICTLVEVLLLMAYQGSQKSSAGEAHAAEPSEAKKKYSQVTLKEERRSDNIGITTYTLITDDFNSSRRDAEVIMQLKWDLPLAMQTKDRNVFNRILARNFTFRGENEFYEREDYIRNRVERKEIVESADYQNLVLQFFGETAVLTYRNIVRVKNVTDNPEVWRMSWSDVFIREDGQWKIGAIHLIEARVEK
jgi:hypothetical protein